MSRGFLESTAMGFARAITRAMLSEEIARRRGLNADGLLRLTAILEEHRLAQAHLAIELRMRGFPGQCLHIDPQHAEQIPSGVTARPVPPALARPELAGHPRPTDPARRIPAPTKPETALTHSRSGAGYEP